MTQRSLTEQFLATASAPARATRRADPDKDFTRQIEVKGDTAEVTIRAAAGQAGDDIAAAALAEQGLDPAEWEVSGFRKSEWTMASGELGESARFSFRRRPGGAAMPVVPIDDLLEVVKAHRPARVSPLHSGDAGYVVAIGDMQFGKIDGDGVDGTLRRSLQYIDKAAAQLDWYRKRFDIGHVHIGWLGDHVEGFVSQGGANAWRTPLTLSEQIRLTRRVMLYAVQSFAPLAERVSCAAVPGNHGDTVRFNGKGVTRYDDSHDTEALVAVADACAMNPKAFGHVEFYTPSTDEMTVVLDVAGTVVGHAHGHQWRPGKHFEWWEKQAFGAPGLHQADLLLAGHLHHEFIESRGSRLFVQVPALESESTWYRHAQGVTGNPGLLALVTQDGATNQCEVIR